VHTVNLATTAEVPLDDNENDSMAVASITVTATTEAVCVAKAPAPRVLHPGLIKRLSESAKRFVSSFRGRTVHGVEVALPKGYVGIILRGDADGRTCTAAGNAKRRPTWQPREIPAEGYMHDTPGMLLDEDGPMRMLRPTARFDAFVLWHPDIAVDEGKDEYLRSLSEWVNISAEVRVSDCPSLRSSG
jgi:Ribonuclease H2 non-catalytic subunit (Ylr154p-like)